MPFCTEFEYAKHPPNRLTLHPRRSYLEAVDMGSKRLGLVAIDATPVPGLKRPFNFLGSLAEKELSKIKQLLGAV